MRVFVIAEAGVNHNGDLGMAFALVDEAARAGADAVKFQTFRADRLTVPAAPKAEYQLATTGSDDSQHSMLRKLELSPEAHFRLRDRCGELGIEFMSTAFDIDSLHLLTREVGVRRIKVPSGEITNGPLLAAMAAANLPMIVSTGMSALPDVREALSVIASVWRIGTPSPNPEILRGAEAAALLQHGVTLLHCTTEYPAPIDEINLRAMDRLRREFRLPVGLSDHSAGVVAAVAAAARGATLIEKHFTLDRMLPGPDHKASLEPSELRRMIEEIRLVERALGRSVKKPTASELGNRSVARRSLVASRTIAAGEPFGPGNVTAKRPGTGISPMRYWDLVGRAARRDYSANDLIEAEELT